MKNPFSPLSSILESLFKKDKSPLSEIYFLFQLHRNWKQLAGEEIAKSARPSQFKNQELILTLARFHSSPRNAFFKGTFEKKDQ